MDILKDFDGWGGDDNVDLFNTDNTDVITEVEKTDVEVNETPQVADNEEKNTDDDLFSNNVIDEIPNGEPIIPDNVIDTEQVVENKDNTDSKIVNYLVEQNIIPENIINDEEGLTGDDIAGLIEETVVLRTDEKVKELVSNLSPDAQATIQFIMKGGDISQLSNINQSGLPDDLDLSDIDNQALVIRSLASDEETPAEVEARIEFLSSTGKLESIAKTKYDRSIAKKQETAEKLLKEQELQRKANLAELKKHKQEMTTLLQSKKEIGGLRLDRKDKTSMSSYMLDKTFNDNTGKQYTGFEKDLFFELPKNKEAMLQLGILLANRNDDGTFNFDKITDLTKSKVISNVKNKIARQKVSIPNKSASPNHKTSGASLADFF